MSVASNLSRRCVLEAHGVGERVHRKRVLGCALRSEEVDPGPERQDEIVVRKRRHLREANLALGQIDGADRVLVHHHVRLLVEQVAQRVPDVGRLEQGGRDLVQERLERAVVALVDQHDLRARVLELAHGADAGEPSAEDENAWCGCWNDLAVRRPGFMAARERSRSSNARTHRWSGASGGAVYQANRNPGLSCSARFHGREQPALDTERHRAS